MKTKSNKEALKMITRREIGCNIIIAVCFFVCLYGSYCLYSDYQADERVNKARIVLQDDYERVIHIYEEEQFTADNVKSVVHSFCVLGLDGSVIYDSDLKDKETQQNRYNLVKELQIDHAYAADNRNMCRITFPIMREEQVDSFVIFTINYSELDLPVTVKAFRCLLPLIIWSVCVIIIIFIRTAYRRKKVYLPLTMLEEAAESILAGDYSDKFEIDCDRANEIVSKLSYSFDMMRDELYNKSVREEALKKSQKELLSCMSHDLRTPITTIQAHVEALRDGIYRTEDKQKEALDIILRKAIVLSEMIEKLLEHSNTELHQLSITRKECYQKSFFDNLYPELETYCRNSGCSFIYMNNCQDMLLFIDEGRITEVIYNLVENACKYMSTDVNDRHSEVRLSCRQLEAERKLEVCVEDNGTGIDVEDIPYVFERFYRAEKSRSMRIPGTGLGLSICKYIIEAHDGTIDIESHKNTGTKVKFTLPY